jgi:hypothetical protein
MEATVSVQRRTIGKVSLLSLLLLDNFLRDDRNQVLGICIDGANPFEEKTVYSYTPIMGQFLNMPEQHRKKIKNILLIGLVPGPNAPQSYQPYLDVYA